MAAQQPLSMATDLMRTQLMMGLVQAGGRSAPLRNMILLNVYERIVQNYPTWFPTLKAFCCRRHKNTAASTPPPPPNKEQRAVITCERILQSSQGKQNSQSASNHSRMDSVVHYVTTIPAIRNLICMTHHDYLPHEFDPVLVEPDLYFQMVDLKYNDGQVDSIKFKLFCYEHEVQYLQAFVDRCNVDYERRMANKLGTSLYYFDMVTQTKTKKTTQNPLPNTHLIYTKHTFHTTRSFDNVFFEQRTHLKNHLDFFLNRRDWYEKKGIPYTLGFMFHGDPGCGKTSSIKAIANTARRHIVNIQLSQIKSKEQLRHLFFNDEIHVYDGMKTERFTIPVHERLYVIEDIDAMGDSVLRRDMKKPTEQKVTKDDAWMEAHREEEQNEPLDLSFLLNLLDGTLEASGRILAITSNFPERIDKALIRPGRIDMIVHFRKCNVQILKEMVNSFYDKEFEEWTISDLDYKWSPAEVNQILFRNFTSPETALVELLTLTPKDLIGFDSVSKLTYSDQ
jgi:hypothetical protein